MLANYVKIALRNLWKYKAYSLINISGLAVGMACCLLILLFIQEELRHDRFHEQADTIYRVNLELRLPGIEYDLASTMAPLGPALQSEYPEVTQFTRVTRPNEYLVAHEDRRFYEEGLYFADSTIFEVFTFPLLRGDPAQVLDEPFSVVLTEAMARKYFGQEDPIGKVLTLRNEYELKVTGVLAPVPSYSHFKFDFLVSFSTLQAISTFPPPSWHDISMVHTYVVMPGTGTAPALEAKLPDLLRKHIDEEATEAFTLYLQPLTDIYFSEGLANGIGRGGDLASLYIFGSIALLVLLIASINFINLSTARSANRAREVGMRKVLGAHRFQLVKQFLGESVLLSLLALLLAVGLVKLLLPAFNQLVEKDLTAEFLNNGLLLGALVLITLVVGVVSGSYPAFVLSSFQPVAVLKGRIRGGAGGVLFRKGLVVVQFVISILLITGSFIMSAQLNFFTEKDLGFNSEQVLVIPLRDQALRQSYDTFKRTLLQNPQVVQVSGASSTPGSNSYSLSTYLPEDTEDGEEVGIVTVLVDPDVEETLGLQLIEGRGFSSDYPTDTSSAIILNEAAVAQFGWEQGAGKTLTESEREVTVIGVVKDFHFSSVDEEIKPMVLRGRADAFSFLTVRISPQQIPATLRYIREQWSTFAPAYPFEYRFVDEDFAENYESTRRQGQMIRSFTLLAIVIACLGLFGLVSFTTQQRTKEIGVRKALGASVTGILLLLSKDYFKLVLFAFLLAGPLTYFVMSRWLEDFPYRIEIGPGVFLLSGFLALLLTLLTVIIQSVRAALADPVTSLRYE